jgi:PiT family inorganic phosphate transporter
MGSRITANLRPIGGFSAECAAATSIALATFARTPISTTHAIAGGVAGVGAARGARAVRWQWGEKIAGAWALTFPGAALIGAVAYVLAHGAIEPFIPAVGTG